MPILRTQHDRVTEEQNKTYLYYKEIVAQDRIGASSGVLTQTVNVFYQ